MCCIPDFKLWRQMSWLSLNGFHLPQSADCRSRQKAMYMYSRTWIAFGNSNYSKQRPHRWGARSDREAHVHRIHTVFSTVLTNNCKWQHRVLPIMAYGSPYRKPTDEDGPYSSQYLPLFQNNPVTGRTDAAMSSQGIHLRMPALRPSSFCACPFIRRLSSNTSWAAREEYGITETLHFSGSHNVVHVFGS